MIVTSKMLKKAARRTATRKVKGARSVKAVAKTMAPVATARKISTGKPRVSSTATGDIRVVHREYVRDIPGSVGFTATSFPVNPGQSALFPWLSTLASRFESYRFLRLRFALNTMSTTAATGSVALALDYDAADAAPTSKLQAMSYRSSVRDAPWKDLDFESTSEDLRRANNLYIRTLAVLPANLDIKTYDTGNLFVVTQGQAGTTAVSELYVEYDVQLITPQIDSLGATTVARVNGSTGLSSTVLFGTSPVIDADSTLAVSVNAAGTILTFLQDFNGLAISSIAGTVLSAMTTGSSTATVSAFTASAGTNNTVLITVNYIAAQAGQTYQLGITQTTITAASHTFVAAPNAIVT
jgi:hypothetical protein